MLINLGKNAVIRKKEIIGIFDLDSSTVVKNTRDYLSAAEKKGDVITVSYDLPKAFIVCANSKTEQKIYISQYSAATLVKRSEEPF